MNYGRTMVLTDVNEITDENVVSVVTNAAVTHRTNCGDYDRLYNYYKGKQDILYRVKTIRPDINNKIVENRANEIVSFKSGYLVGEPIQYVSRISETSSESIARLNSFMEIAGKASRDAELADDMHIYGLGLRLVLPSEAPSGFDLITVDPHEGFVVYSSNIYKKPMLGVVVMNEDSPTGGVEPIYSAYTDKYMYTIKSGKILKKETHIIGSIPLIEYPLNKARLGSFEIVMPLLDAINTFDSCRLDSIEQFVQSILVLKNVMVDDDITAKDIAQAGLLQIRSDNGMPADVEDIAKQLDQSQNQTLKDDMHRTILEIVGMPSQADGKSSDSSNNGAVIMRNGWQSAEARAKRTEMMWRDSENKMLTVVLKILGAKSSSGIRLGIEDIAIKFTRRQYEALSEKVTALTAMLGNDKIAPIDAWTISGVTCDPEECARRGLEWSDEQTKKAERQAQIEAERMAAQNAQQEQPNEVENDARNDVSV